MFKHYEDTLSAYDRNFSPIGWMEELIAKLIHSKKRPAVQIVMVDIVNMNAEEQRIYDSLPEVITGTITSAVSATSPSHDGGVMFSPALFPKYSGNVLHNQSYYKNEITVVKRGNMRHPVFIKTHMVLSLPYFDQKYEHKF